MSSRSVATEVSVTRRSGTGVPIRVPTVDLAEVGAGGGSIAWRDMNGTVHVGPQSSGAVPGPACYGRGGVAPTVTDADVVLGYLDLSSAAELRDFDPALARRAIEVELAQPLGVPVETAASRGVRHRKRHDVGRVCTWSRSSGASTPVGTHSSLRGERGRCMLQRWRSVSEFRQVLVPPAAGVASAVGLLTSDLRSEQVRAMHVAGEEIAAREIEDMFREMEDRGGGRARSLRRPGRCDAAPGHGCALSTPSPPSHHRAPGPGVLRGRLGRCRPAVLQRAPGSLRGRPAGTGGAGQLAASSSSQSVGKGALSATRTSLRAEGNRPRIAIGWPWSSARRTMVETPVVDRAICEPGSGAAGPILIEDREATVLVPAEWSALFLEDGTTQLDRTSVTR